MKPSLLIASFLIFLSSCNQFNYLTVSGKNVPKNEKHQLVSENDTLSIEYNFSEKDGKVGLKILNKTDDMVEIDWKKSAIILGGRAISYYNPEAVLSGNMRTDLPNPELIQRADIKATIAIDGPSQYVFPLSYIVKTSSPLPFGIHIKALDSLKKTAGEKLQLLSGDPTPVSYKRFQFSEEQSPIVFRSFLTFRMGKGTGQKEFTQEHVFYISELWQSAHSAEEFPEKFVKRPDLLSMYP